jgi:16S rRNA (guanine966-N2)-methyltransferase
LRIVGGHFGGRRLVLPKDARVRPTADRVREAWMSILGDALPDARVLDLFAGSGALGLEALSRGAVHALFVESDRRAAGVLRRNAAALGFADTEVRVAPAATVLAAPADRAYDVVLVDPPYDVPATEVAGWLAAGAAHGWLTDGAVVVVERAGRDGAFPWPPPLRAARERRYGDTTLHTAVLVADR